MPMVSSKWEEFVSLEGKMRKQRQDHEHRKQEIRNNIINWIVGLFFGTIGHRINNLSNLVLMDK
jgi:hypothetical protein